MLIIKKAFTLLVALSYLNTFVFSSFVYGANQQVDTSKSPTTFIDQTANGVDLINIANPNAKGVSANHYNKFNVGNQGAILNNSRVMGTSQLGGVIYGNPNLNREADIILNEVSSTDRSFLNGALEVFGNNAAVVIANPNGFDCNGCSFINASKLTMVSGNSELTNGAITGFKLNNDLTSDFVIGVLGLYANNTDSVNIISRAIKLRGELQAKQDLALKQGNDYYDYVTGEVKSDASAAAIEFGIDASYLTNISAGRISIIVTEKGAGVNTTAGDIVTDLSRLEISADGDLILKANLGSQSDINLTSNSGDITQSGDIKAVQNININANQTYQNQGKDTIAQTNLDITANIINSNGGQLTADNNTNIKADGDITLNSNVQSQGGINLTSNQGQITQTGDLTSNSDINLQASNDINQSGNINSQKNIILISNTGSIKQSGNLIANLAVDLSADNHIEQLGRINAQEKINLTSKQGQITQTGDLLANSDINLQASNDINQSGNINSQKNIILISNTGSIKQSGNLIANLAVDLSADNHIEQLGNINAQQTINLTSNKGAITQVGNLFANADINLQANNDINQSGNVNSQQNIALISNTGSINHSGNLVANSNINLSSNSNITQSGDIKATQNININAQRIYQNEGKDTIAQNNLDITANTVNNKGGQLAAGNDLNITADTLNNTQNTEQTQGGLIYAGNKLDLAIASQLNNDQSSIVAQSDININGANLIIDNKSGTIQSDSNINITAKNLNNIAYRYDTKEDDSDGFYGYDVNEKVHKSDHVMDDTVVIEQDEQISTLGSNASFITALKDIDINLSNDLFNSSSVISAKENLTITANKVTNETDSVDTHDMYRLLGKKWVESWEDCGWHDWSYGCTTHYRDETSSWNDARSELAYSKDKGTLAAGQNLIINANESITNGEVIQNNEFLIAQVDTTDITDNTQVPDATTYQGNDILNDSLVRNGQFKINKPSANQPYVIETRNEFTDLNKFKASQYLFARPSIRFLDPTIPNPMVMGDAYWEHERLKRQIAEQTKTAELYAGYDMNAIFERLFTQSNEEFEKLTSAGVAISFGVSLSKEAIKALTQDIIWYENAEVAIGGEKHIALVPRLYLANATLDDLEKSPQAFFAAQNITLSSGGTIDNRGQIAAEKNTNITASNIINQGGIIKGNDVNLDARNVIINQSGDIKANNDLTLTGQTVANIASETTHKQRRDTTKTVGNASTIAGKDITISANNVINTASNINASNNLEIIANNLSIGTQQNTTDLKAGGGSNYSNSQSITHQSSNINVSGDLNIQADNINIQGSKVSANNALIKSDNLTISSVQDSKSVQMQSKSSGGFFGGSSKSSSNSQTITTQGSELDIANQLNIQNQQTQIIASKVTAKAIEIETGILKLISQKDLDYLKQTSDSSGFLTRTITDKGHNKESKIIAQIGASDQLTINPQTLTKLSAPSVNNQLTNTQRETLKQLTSADNLKASFDEALKQQLTAQNINLVDVNLNNQDWDESTTTLSGLGKIIVQVASMYFTGGFDVLGSATGTQLTAQQAFTQAAITSVKSQMVSALATSAITGNSLNLDPEQILKTALTAGASQYAMAELSVQTKYNSAKDFNTNLVGGLQRAGVNSVVSTAINGGSLANNLKQNLGAEALNVTTAKLANEIGANKQSLGEVGHKAAHAALGCAGAKVQGKDCASGAVGAVAGEVIAQHVGQNQDLTDDDVQAISRIGTAVIAQGLGKDTEVADTAAKNAVENNYIIHAPGTFSNKEDVSKEFKEGLKEFYQDDNLIVMDNGKDLENSKEAREELADKIVTQIIKVKQQNPDEPIRLTGHSHGGNVQKLVTKKLVAQGHQNIVDDMMFLASPVRKDYQTNNKALTPEAKVLNVSDKSDVVQRLGGTDTSGENPSVDFAKQTIDNNPRVSNIEIEVPNKIGINHIISPAILFTNDALHGDHIDMDSKATLDKVHEKLNE